jgi:hypothetical protein
MSRGPRNRTKPRNPRNPRNPASSRYQDTHVEWISTTGNVLQLKSIRHFQSSWQFPSSASQFQTLRRFINKMLQLVVQLISSIPPNSRFHDSKNRAVQNVVTQTVSQRVANFGNTGTNKPRCQGELRRLKKSVPNRKTQNKLGRAIAENRE